MLQSAKNCTLGHLKILHHCIFWAQRPGLCLHVKLADFFLPLLPAELVIADDRLGEDVVVGQEPGGVGLGIVGSVLDLVAQKLISTGTERIKSLLFLNLTQSTFQQVCMSRLLIILICILVSTQR